MQLPTPEQRIFFETAASQYQNDLEGDTAGQAYLRSRGIPAAAARTFRLGVVAHPVLGHEQYAGRLSIPYLTPSGVVTFSFRCMQAHTCSTHVAYVDAKGKEHHCRKYMAPEGVERTLFNVLDLRRAGLRIYLVEGEIDAITWSMCGWPTLGIPGVENFKDFHGKVVSDYAEVFAITDGDTAGYKLGSFLAREVRATVIRLPRGEDGNSLYVKEGRDGLARVLAA